MSDLAIVSMPEAALRFVHENTCLVRWPKDDLPWKDWRFAYGILVDRWLDGGRCAVVDAGDEVYLGFALASEGLVRMVYVKPGFRGNGLGIRLLDAVETRKPHCPNMSWRLWSRGWPTTRG